MHRVKELQECWKEKSYAFPHPVAAAEEDEEAVSGDSGGPEANGPTINGVAQVGQTLTADTSGISDPDGLTNASFTYQWLADDVEISGATNSSYAPVEGDVGKAIKVRVSFTDDANNNESLTSEATEAVTPIPAPLTAAFHNAPNSHDGSAAFTVELRFSESPKGLSYTTLENDAFNVTGAVVTSASRLQRDSNQRWQITVTPSGNNSVTVSLPATTDCADAGAICAADGRMLSEAAEIVIPGPSSQQNQQQNSPATGAPAISGMAQVGETLTADTSGISDADGLTNASFTYQWLADDTEISNATGGSYELVDADEGKAIKVRVSFTDDAGNPESLTSAATAAVAERPNRPATGAPAIVGTAQVGQTLAADTSGISDADGMTNASFTYQWLADDTEISNATGSSYELVAADEGKVIKVRVNFTDDANHAETLTSAATAAVAPLLPLTSSAIGAPSSHDGAVFTFELRFSEKPKRGFSYSLLEEHAFTVTGGEVTKASRLERGKNLRWAISVAPGGNGTVTVVLPPTTDCAATGAICAQDGRMLSNRLELTVAGP